MRLIKSLSLLLTTLLLACAAPAGNWVRDNSLPLQVDQDKYACLQQAQQPYGYTTGGFGWGPGWGGFNGYSGVETNPELYSACMKARGYTWVLDNPQK